MPGIRPTRLPLAWGLLAAWLAAAGRLPADTARPDDKPAGSHGSGDALQRQIEDLCLLTGRLCPLERRLLADAADGRLDEFSLLAAAVVASGEQDPRQLRHYQQRQAALIDQLRQSGRLDGSPRDQVRAVFELMHERILQGEYREDSTDLRAAWDEGRFNCVSASVLLNSLAGELGMDVRGLETPGHAMSRVMLPDGPLDIETTYPHWFELAAASDTPAEPATKPIGPADAADSSQAREVSAAEMVAMIYYNRGLDLLGEERFAEAAAANAKALRLDPRSTTARGNLLATLNNWAIALGSSGRYGEAVELLRAGLRLDPEFETFTPNYVHVHHQWVEHLCRCGRFDEALGILARAAAEMPEREYFRHAATDVDEKRGQNDFRRKSF